MKKLIIYFVLGATLLATALFQTLPVAIASNSTTRANAQFIATIRVTNNGSAVSDVVGVLNLSTQSLIDGNFVNFNFTDSAFLTNAGGDTGFMPAASGSTFVLCLESPHLLTSTSHNILFFRWLISVVRLL